MRESLTNPDYERSILGAIMYDNTLVDRLQLPAHIFANREHRELYDCIREIIADGGVAGYTTVAGKLPTHTRTIERCQSARLEYGLDYVTRELTELYTLRQLDGLAYDIETMSREYDSERVLSEIDSRTLEITQGRGADYEHIRTATSEAVDAIEAAHNRKGELSGADTGLPSLNRMLDGFQASEVTIVGARPSTGKTAFALQAAEAMQATHPVGIFSAEMSRRMLATRLLSRSSSVEGQKLRSGYLTRSEFSRIVDGAGSIGDYRIWIDDTPNIEIGRLVSTARRMYKEHGIRAIIIDYMGLVRHEQHDIPRWQQYIDISQRLKGLARELDIPVVVLTQISRDSEGKRPTPASIRDSGAIEQDADTIIFLHTSGEAEEDRIPVEVIVSKQRNGPVGTIQTAFARDKMRFYEVDSHE